MDMEGVIFQFDPNDLQSLLADAEEFSHLMDENEESGTNMTPLETHMMPSCSYLYGSAEALFCWAFRSRILKLMAEY